MKGAPPTIKPFHDNINKNLSPKNKNSHPPIFGHFQAIIAAAKTAKVSKKCIRESAGLNSGLKPSKIKMAKKATIKIVITLGK